MSYTNIIIHMKKEQVKEYFQQLKNNENASNMNLAEVIDLITGGAVGLQNIRLFIEETLENQLGKYNQIYQYLKLSDWKQLQFDEIYLILKCLKDHCKTHRILTQSKVNSDMDVKEVATSFDSRHINKQNRTIQSLVHQMSQKQILINSQKSEQSMYEEKQKQTKYKVLKKLFVVFDYLRKMMQVQGESFQKKKLICQKLDLNMYMKYIKQFQFGFVFKSDKIIKCFKDNAFNHLWLDFDSFVSTNFQMIGLKESLSNKDKYLRLRGLSDILASEKIKKMLNLRGKIALATIVEGHIGTYKRDIIDYLKLKPQQTKITVLKASRQKLKTQGVNNSPKKQQKNVIKKVSKSQSAKVISTRAKTLESIAHEQNLKLSNARLKPTRSQSIYQSLKQFNLKKEEERLRKLVNVEESQEFLNEYLKRQQNRKEFIAKKIKKPLQLPPIKFS